MFGYHTIGTTSLGEVIPLTWCWKISYLFVTPYLISISLYPYYASPIPCLYCLIVISSYVISYSSTTVQYSLPNEHYVYPHPGHITWPMLCHLPGWSNIIPGETPDDNSSKDRVLLLPCRHAGRLRDQHQVLGHVLKEWEAVGHHHEAEG